MIVVLPVCEKDKEAALRNLEWCAALETSAPFDCIVSSEHGFDASSVLAAARRYFRTVTEFRYAPLSRNRSLPWPQPQNHAWKSILKPMASLGQPWLWWEQDAVPLRAGWLRSLSDAYAVAARPFLGCLGEKLTPQHPDHLAGVAVYPPSIFQFASTMAASPFIPFDTLGGWRVLEHAALTPLIQHVWSWQQLPVRDRAPCTFPDASYLTRIDRSAVLFHRCKDGSLVERLREASSPARPTVTGQIRHATRIPTCFHSGDLGDVIYSLLFCRSLGRVNLILGPDPSVKVRSPFTPEKFEWFASLLRRQSFLNSVTFSPTPPACDYNLNRFRDIWFHPSRKSRCLFQAYFEIFHASPVAEDCAWLAIDAPIPTHPVVVNRTSRYRNPEFSWQTVATRYASRIAFLGTDEEFADWRRDFGDTAEHILVVDALHMARIIAGARLFVGNQSFPMSLALALNVPLIQETSPKTSDCVFRRPNAQFSIPGPIRWPDLFDPDTRFVSRDPSPDGFIEVGPQHQATGLGDILSLTPLAAHLPKAVVCLTPALERYAPLFTDLCPVKFTAHPPWFKHVGGVNMALSKLQFFGLSHVSPIPLVRISDTEKVEAQLFLDPFDNPLAFCPTCSKTWSHIRGRPPQFWEPIISFLTAQGVSVLQFGDESYPLVPGATRAPFVGLRKLAAFYSVIGQYLGVDTGDYHLAVATGCSCVVLRPPEQEGYCPREWEYDSPNITYLPLNNVEVLRYYEKKANAPKKQPQTAPAYAAR